MNREPHSLDLPRSTSENLFHPIVTIPRPKKRQILDTSLQVDFHADASPPCFYFVVYLPPSLPPL
ncbi:unnamed protein product [Periconia digitata]|uniref:Uncharacterized protein n=1 Tax=Periconia digitata TaxID=1303443 RepID=A0A9W4USQ3_9PLEO|nr:unnamed protein product [Periconia digitata]